MTSSNEADLIVIPLGRWHQCAFILQDRKFRSHKSPIVYTEEGWLFARLPITHCPFCGERIHCPSYSMARMDASPW